MLEGPWEAAEETPLEAPFLSAPDFAALASNSRRNCSLFMVARAVRLLGVEAELSLGARGWQLKGCGSLQALEVTAVGPPGK